MDEINEEEFWSYLATWAIAALTSKDAMETFNELLPDNLKELHRDMMKTLMKLVNNMEAFKDVRK